MSPIIQPHEEKGGEMSVDGARGIINTQDNLLKVVDHLARVHKLNSKLYLQCFYQTHTGNSRHEQSK